MTRTVWQTARRSRSEIMEVREIKYEIRITFI